MSKERFQEGKTFLLKSGMQEKDRLMKFQGEMVDRVLRVIEFEERSSGDTVVAVDQTGSVFRHYTKNLKKATKAQEGEYLFPGDVVQVDKDSYWYNSRGLASMGSGRSKELITYIVKEIYKTSKGKPKYLLYGYDSDGDLHQCELSAYDLNKIGTRPGGLSSYKVGDKVKLSSMSSYYKAQGVDSKGDEIIYIVDEVEKGSSMPYHCYYTDPDGDRVGYVYGPFDLDIVERAPKPKEEREIQQGDTVVLKKTSKYFEDEGKDSKGELIEFRVDSIILPKNYIVLDSCSEEVHDVQVVDNAGKIFMYPYTDLGYSDLSGYVQINENPSWRTPESKKTRNTSGESMRQMLDVLQKVYDNPELRKSSVPLFIGDPGLGKTKMIEKFAEERGVKLVELITSQMSPFEISGIAMPDKDSKKMTYFNFDKIEELEDGDILFFDELLNGNPTVLNACLTILEQRRLISGKPLPDLMIIAAANPQGMVPLTPQIKERFIWYTVEFSPNMWKNYMEDKYGMPEEISDKLCTLIKNEEFLTNNFKTPRSIDKAVSMLIKDCPTPYESLISPQLMKRITNVYRETEVKIGESILTPGESTTWLQLQKIK